MRPERFELPTYCSGGNRSIHLSYGRAAGRFSLHARVEWHQCKRVTLFFDLRAVTLNLGTQGIRGDHRSGTDRLFLKLEVTSVRRRRRRRRGHHDRHPGFRRARRRGYHGRVRRRRHVRFWGEPHSRSECGRLPGNRSTR